jgi:hypothetical protein
LVTVDGLPIAGAQSGQKVEESLIFHLALTELYEIHYSFFGDLFIKQDLIILEKLSDRGLCTEVVLFSCGHGLVEVKLDELSDIELIIIIVFDAMLQETVNKLANPCNRMLLSEVAKVIEFVLERILKNIHKQIDNTSFTHNLLTLFEGKTLTGERVTGFGFCQEEYHT